MQDNDRLIRRRFNAWNVQQLRRAGQALYRNLRYPAAAALGAAARDVIAAEVAEGQGPARRVRGRNPFIRRRDDDVHDHPDIGQDEHDVGVYSHVRYFPGASEVTLLMSMTQSFQFADPGASVPSARGSPGIGGTLSLGIIRSIFANGWSSGFGVGGAFITNPHPIWAKMANAYERYAIHSVCLETVPGFYVNSLVNQPYQAIGFDAMNQVFPASPQYVYDHPFPDQVINGCPGASWAVGNYPLRCYVDMEQQYRLGDDPLYQNVTGQTMTRPGSIWYGVSFSSSKRETTFTDPANQYLCVRMVLTIRVTFKGTKVQ